MSTTHTPGPWTIGEEGEILAGLNAFHVATASQHRPQCDANARLIAAAPDLLAALETALKALEYCAAAPGYLQPANNQPHVVAHNALETVRAAIAKATQS